MSSSLLLDPKYASETVQTVGLFPRGHVSLVAGEPGCGKTWFMLETAKAVVEGGFAPGVYDVRQKPGRVLIFAGETGVRLLASRVQLMGGLYPLEACRVISSHVCAKMDLDCMVNTAIGRKNIDDAVNEFKPDIVFFDTLISFVASGTDESKQVDMTDAIRSLSSTAANTGAAFVMMHHYRKRSGQKELTARGMDDVIGTSAFTRLASLLVGIDRRNDIRDVRCLKSWWQEFSPFSFVIAKEGDCIQLKCDYVNTVEGTAILPVANRIARIIESDFRNRKFSVMDVASVVDASRSAVSEAVSLLISAGKVRFVGKDSYTKMYEVVENGEE